jgi:hypothetical protein
MPQMQSRGIVILSLWAGLWLATGAHAANWSAEFDLSDERKTEVSETAGVVENPTTETIKQTYTVSYDLELNPALKYSLGLKLDVTDEIKEGPKPGTDFDTHGIKPGLDFDVTAKWWDFKATWSDDIKSTQDRKVDKTEAVTSDAELNMQPPGDTLPDVKAKYKRDFNRDGGAVQKADTSWEGSLDYKLWTLLDFSVDAQRTFTDDLVQVDQDKEDRKLSTDVSLHRDIGESLKVEAKWANERSLSRTFKDTRAEDEGKRTDTLKNSVEGKATYKPLEALELSIDKKIDWNSDLVKPSVDVEVTDDLTSSAKFDHSLTQTIDLSASYEDERKDTRGKPESTAYEINKGYSTSLDFTPLKDVTFNSSFDRQDDLKWLAHKAATGSAKNHKIDDKVVIKADTSTWDDNVKVTVTRSLNTTRENGDNTADQDKWDLDFEIAFDSFPNLALTPKYTFTEDNDLIKETTTQERKVDIGLKYEISFNKVLSFKIDHTYGRTNKGPAEGKPTIVRDDSTDLTLSWNEFLKGMKAEVDFTRKATDESQDDKGPIIDYAYKTTLDWDILKNYKFSFNYTLDRKQESADTQSFKTTFSADFLENLLSLNFEHEFTEQLEEETKDTHRYLIELQGKF